MHKNNRLEVVLADGHRIRKYAVAIYRFSVIYYERELKLKHEQSQSKLLSCGQTFEPTVRTLELLNVYM
jgi:hypothetical protein